MTATLGKKSSHRLKSDSISMPKGHGIALAPLKGAKLSFIEGKLES